MDKKEQMAASNGNGELIPLLYVSKGQPEQDLSSFSKKNGFSLNICEDPLLAKDHVKSCPPDLIVIESGKQDLPENLNVSEFLERCALHFSQTVFFIVREMPGIEDRLLLMKKGVSDFLIAPVSHEEVSQKYKIYHQCRISQIEQRVLEKKIKSSFEYLDQFKTELKTAKNTLFEERETLNNALKQINQMTIERNRLRQEKQELKKRLSTNIDGFSDILYKLIEARVEKNRGHGERVSHIAHFVAKQLKIDEKKLEDLRKAAMLHEVGLLLVPEAVLKKTRDQLSDYERDLMDSYPLRGSDFFLECSEFKECAKIIHSMNENSDGTGRPDRLKRRYIPLLSRILAGADVFDTLKDEPDVNSLATFLERLEDYAGTRLDPNIVAWLEKYAVVHMGSDDYRVKGVGIHQLEPGMTLGTALFTHTGTKLFSVNTLLTQDAIVKIKNYNREYPVDETVYIRA